MNFARTVIAHCIEFCVPQGLGLHADSLSHDRLGDPPVNIKFNNALFFCWITPSPISVTVLGYGDLRIDQVQLCTPAIDHAYCGDVTTYTFCRSVDAV